MPFKHSPTVLSDETQLLIIMIFHEKRERGTKKGQMTKNYNLAQTTDDNGS